MKNRARGGQGGKQGHQLGNYCHNLGKKIDEAWILEDVERRWVGEIFRRSGGGN